VDAGLVLPPRTMGTVSLRSERRAPVEVMMSALPATIALDEARATLRRQKALADRALAQLEPSDWHALLDGESNSIAVIVRHMAGNMRSRWTDFLHSDGEKPTRDRDAEFALRDDRPAALLEVWEEGWRVTLAAVDALSADDLGRTVTIRGEPHTAFGALLRQVDHYGQHVGQIIMLARHWRGDAWQPLSMPTPRRS
jgi:hypothetical protein